MLKYRLALRVKRSFDLVKAFDNIFTSILERAKSSKKDIHQCASYIVTPSSSETMIISCLIPVQSCGKRENESHR